MMDVREKLVELLKNNRENYLATYIIKHRKSYEEYTADHLISNGVTVQEWISVEDRLPETCVSVLARCYYHGKWRSLVCHTSKIYSGEWYTNEAGQWVQVTHWMPLPEPPKGE